ncbi:chemotaxis protein CheB [Mucilaginibacter paludis]|uniref:Signal transduction histidine kinase with CheB and CheR activity n=1 Tax=Mucilaginibacter paludis DSM 18603 TaxID=714943 RepID=H1Y664_9SPHI|nr:chemotaxis protein CheB [Mucilaginibacter paludis]EHQ31023.1 signal transduction histidine kinase with CheB and CheR activity [Mucilaginibacter paludis DSM 18603]
MQLTAPHHIIAIGASAGGMEEINVFFDHTPLDGVSYIIIQHLSSDFKSRMVDLLARHSKLIVKEAAQGMKVMSNEVYLIPNDKYMTISGEELFLSDKKDIKGPHLTINTFFTSLATDCGKKAIGIILSGLGSDGTEGIKAIKKAGGIVMARNPETSGFPSMPAHVIATGLTDFILEPALMPAAIEDYIKYGLEISEEDDDKNIKSIVDLIKANSPLDFSDYKQATILRRTRRRAAAANFPSLSNYLAYLKKNPDEVEVLSKDFLISVTSFFRDKQAFEVIQKEIIPALLQLLAPDEELKIWVAGCATGEEVYSLGILIQEQLQGNFKDTVVKIFATDVDNLALAHAGRGLYSLSIKKHVSTERLEKYFINEGSAFRISPAIRKMVIFAQHDLVKNPPYCNMHFISCRNLLIYMTPVLQKKVFAMLLFGLKKDGYLFLGPSENPMHIIKNLRVVSSKWKIYQNLVAKRTVNFDAFSMPDYLDTKHSLPMPMAETMSKDARQTIVETVVTGLTEDLDFLSLCVDEKNQVVKSFGDTKKYLLQKHFTTNLAELLSKPLAVAFSSLSKSVLNTGKKAVVEHIKMKIGRRTLKVNMAVRPFPADQSNRKMLVVTLNEDKSGSVAENKVDVYDPKVYQDQYAINLEEEVKELKDKLQSALEKLDSSNENMQSFNEELISANEEMQSTNEEMQSVNEELHTINAEYQSKNKELLETNDDMNNYFRSNVNGQLFVDDDLLLMKFSPGAVKQINLLPSDIGRPLSNISTNIKFETILADITEVLAKGNVITKEIETNNGDWYQVMTMPYVRQADNKRNGAIITFNDISELKKAQQELDLSSKMLGMAIEAAELGTWSINVKTREFTSSSRLKELFGFESAQMMTFPAAIAQIAGNYQLIVSEAIEETINGGKKCDIEFPSQGHHDGKLRWIRAVGNLTHNKENIPNYFSGVLLDITVHKLNELRKNDFIAMVSHELRSPLTSLQANMQLLALKAKKNDDEGTLLAVEKANKQIKKMGTMITGFLDAASLEEGKIYLRTQTFEVNGLLQEIKEEMLTTTTNHQINLLPFKTISVNADRNKIGQVVTNLLSNAVKYSPKGGNIEVSCRTVRSIVEVSVTDEGLGISLPDQAKLFDRYYRIESASNAKIAGFGLGLYLSNEIINRHKGRLWVDSELGKGSTFHFSLPL